MYDGRTLDEIEALTAADWRLITLVPVLCARIRELEDGFTRLVDEMDPNVPILSPAISPRLIRTQWVTRARALLGEETE